MSSARSCKQKLVVELESVFDGGFIVCFTEDDGCEYRGALLWSRSTRFRQIIIIGIVMTCGVDKLVPQSTHRRDQIVIVYHRVDLCGFFFSSPQVTSRSARQQQEPEQPSLAPPRPPLRQPAQIWFVKTHTEVLKAVMQSCTSCNRELVGVARALDR